MEKKQIKKVLDDYLKSYYILSNLIDYIWSCASKYELVSGKISSFTLDDTYIDIYWSDSWAYGGYDEGCKSFPIELLWIDVDEYFTKIVNIKIEKIKLDNEANLKKERLKELEVLKKLQNKYENNNE